MRHALPCLIALLLVSFAATLVESRNVLFRLFRAEPQPFRRLEFFSWLTVSLATAAAFVIVYTFWR